MCAHLLGMGGHSSDTNVRLQVGGKIISSFIMHSLELKNIIIPYLFDCKMRFSLVL
jgi:hypothetical protein